MSQHWTLTQPHATPGDVGPLQIVDRQDGPDGRTVCIIPGHLTHRTPADTVVRLLDEQDMENACLFGAAGRMRSILAELVEWSTQTGGWDAPCWDEAQLLLAQLRGPPDE